MTSRVTPGNDWLYLKMYLGQAVERLDALIVEVIPKVLKRDVVERWFFLRYYDQQGVHLRLRVRLAPHQSQAAMHIQETCQKTLDELHRLAPSDYRPMVVPPGFDPRAMVPPTAQVALVQDVYEPEHEKFGGADAMPIAEEVFEVSSGIAVQVLHDEAAGAYSRKTVAPCFLAAAREVFDSKEGASQFWRQYSTYWLGGDTPAAQDWRQRFFDKGQQLAHAEIPIVAGPGALPQEAAPLVDQWRAALERASSAYAGLAPLSSAVADVLAFNFAHLMNNRLGLTSLEEAYLATLLEQRAGRTRTP